MIMNVFWGWLDYNEKIHVKRYTTDKAIQLAQDSGTTIGIFDPFIAKSIEDATHKILNAYRESKFFEKKEIN